MDLDDTSKNGRQRDHDDLQNEMAGRSTGRQRRFLPADGADGSFDGKRSNGRGALTALDILLLTDPVYAALYRQVGDVLATAERETDEAIDAAETALDVARTELQDALDKAARLPNGRRVFRDADGQVWTEDGELLDADTAAGIQWRGDEPSREDYIAHKQAVDEWEAYLDRLRDYQTTVLGSERDRLNDPNDPPSEAELRAILDRIKKERPALRDEIAAELGKNFGTPADKSPVPVSSEAPILDVPDIQTAFVESTAAPTDATTKAPKVDLTIPKL
ncbi:MAG: hypothetical protein AAFV49_19135 [Pseudomonadota bacterium]